jgi:hypothetical protein
MFYYNVEMFLQEMIRMQVFMDMKAGTWGTITKRKPFGLNA